MRDLRYFQTLLRKNVLNKVTPSGEGKFDQYCAVTNENGVIHTTSIV